MRLENMFKKNTAVSEKRGAQTAEAAPEVPEGLLRKCNMCKSAIIAGDVRRDLYICPKCGGYFRMHAWRRVEMIADEGSFEEWDTDLETGNPLDYRGYEAKIAALRDRTGLREAIVTGRCRIDGCEAVLGVCDGRFLMASMGWAVGEKIARAVERAAREQLPVILYACSGGARMQEGITSLMQMAKTAAALKRHSDAGNLFISVLTDPTTGGVTASFAMLGDVILAEPGALIGFAGPRVIEQTIRQKLPKGFQRAEFLLEHGFVDRIVERREQKRVLSELLRLHGQVRQPCADREPSPAGGTDPDISPRDARTLSVWERVEISRRSDRPVGSDYIRALFPDFLELHGDRCFGDDSAVVGGLALFQGIPVTVIAQTKGSGTKGKVEHNFGMPSPEGYRKALRLMRQAEKFHRPVICFVDTPGAFCGMEAEERGQGEAIARNLFEMSDLSVPILSVLIGEGGSGGALAMAVADEVWMLENATYSILSPEGFASILWKDSGRAREAAELMKLTAGDLYEGGFIERIIPEPEHLDTGSMESVVRTLRAGIGEFLSAYGEMSPQKLTQRRYARYRAM